MLGHKRVLHFASLAKYAAAFFWMSRSSVTRASSRFSRRFLSQLKANKGRIINVGSIASFAATTGGVGYGASKGAVLLMTKAMAVELAQLEIRVNGIAPGLMITPMPLEKTVLSGDLVEFDATPYAGDAYFKDWPKTLDKVAALNPKVLVPGRGAALTTPDEVAKGLAGTRAFVVDVYESVKAGATAGRDLKVVYQETIEELRPKYGHWVIFDHCMPFDVTRCYDEVTQYAAPRIWTAERDIQMWKALEG